MNSIPQKILDTIVWSTHNEPIKGGQMAGMPRYGSKLTSEEFRFQISTNYFRSQLQNKEFCMTCFELFLMEIKAI